ncbi:MAG: hypothetical protein V2A74_08935 [bacterium]
MGSKEILKTILDRYPTIKKAAQRVLAAIPLSARLGKNYWYWYEFYQQSEQWSRSQLAEFQLDCVRTLLTDITETSAFYRERLSGVDPKSLDSLETFRLRVPALSREEFRANYDGLRSSEWKKNRLSVTRTSGTTGMALQFYHPAVDNAREEAAINYQWKRVGYVPGKSRRVEFRALTAPGKLVETFPHGNMIRCSILHLKKEHVAHYANEIRKHEMDFIQGYPSALYLLAKEIRSSGMKFPQPKAVLLASEVVYDWQVEEIEKAFPGVRLFAHYGCAERVALAGWCEHRREYHVLPQYAFVEIDETSREIIGTNLFNSVNAFVRYRMADTVNKHSQKPCPDCGRPYVPRMIELGGRSEDYLYSPEFGWIPPAIVTYPLKGLLEIREMQFRQSEKSEIRVLYTVRENGDEKGLVEELRHVEVDLYRLFGRRTKFRFEQVDDFPRGPTGKFKWIISELDEGRIPEPRRRK